MRPASPETTSSRGKQQQNHSRRFWNGGAGRDSTTRPGSGRPAEVCAPRCVTGRVSSVRTGTLAPQNVVGSVDDAVRVEVAECHCDDIQKQGRTAGIDLPGKPRGEHRQISSSECGGEVGLTTQESKRVTQCGHESVQQLDVERAAKVGVATHVISVKADAGSAGAGDFHFESATGFERVIAVNRGETGRIAGSERSALVEEIAIEVVDDKSAPSKVKLTAAVVANDRRFKKSALQIHRASLHDIYRPSGSNGAASVDIQVGWSEVDKGAIKVAYTTDVKLARLLPARAGAADTGGCHSSNGCRHERFCASAKYAAIEDVDLRHGVAEPAEENSVRRVNLRTRARDGQLRVLGAVGRVATDSKNEQFRIDAPTTFHEHHRLSICRKG